VLYAGARINCLAGKRRALYNQPQQRHNDSRHIWFGLSDWRWRIGNRPEIGTGKEWIQGAIG